MTSYRKYKFDPGIEPDNDAAGKLYKCEINKVYDTTYKLYRNLTDEQKKEHKFRLCTLATEDDNKHLLSLLITIDKIETIWVNNKYKPPFNNIKSTIINNCMLEKKDNYYDVLDIMLKYFAHTFVNIDNFKHFLNNVLLEDYMKINPNHDIKSRIIEHINTVISAHTIKDIQKLGSFDIFSKIIKLIVVDILSIIFDTQTDLEDTNVINTFIQNVINGINIYRDDIKDNQTLLHIWCIHSIYDYVKTYMHQFQGLNIINIFDANSTDNILTYRNILIINSLKEIYKLDHQYIAQLQDILQIEQLSISSIYDHLRLDDLLASQLGGSNRKPHTRINYINNKNMYYNL